MEEQMKYLSFDIECCDGRHICEFGYVIIDEQFNVLERDCITINPEHKFKLCGREKERDITLAYPEHVYFNSPTFDYYYDRIKTLLTMPNCQIIGFSLKNDVNYLTTACDLYGKESIYFKYYDFQLFYQAYTKAQNRTSVKGFVKELEISNITLHKSDDDSWAVIRALQVISVRENATLPETLKMLKKRLNDYRAEQAKEKKHALVRKIISGNLKEQNEFLNKYIRELKASKEKKDEIFWGKAVCISSHFQKERFYEFISIIERLYSFGATYTGKPSICDIFIDYQDDEEGEVRLQCVKQAIETEGKNIQVISLDEALNMLGLTMSDLSKKDHFINTPCINKKRIRRGKDTYYKDKTNTPTTIGDILKAKGTTITG